MNIKKSYIFIPACAIGHFLRDGREVIRQNILTPSDTKIRCDRGAQLFLDRKKQGCDDTIITSGGIFLPKERQTRAAADLMKEYLVDAYGIEEEKIWPENQSLDSWENIQLTAGLLEAKGIQPAQAPLIIVSHWTHVLRLGYTAARNGFAFTNLRGVFLDYPIGCKETLKQLAIVGLALKDPQGLSATVKEEKAKRRQPQ